MGTNFGDIFSELNNVIIRGKKKNLDKVMKNKVVVNSGSCIFYIGA